MDITKEEILKKALELSKKYGCDITPFAFRFKEKQVVGYLKDPDRINKMKAIDLVLSGSKMEAGEIILRTSLCAESDSIILSDEKIHDDIFTSACFEAYKMLGFCMNELKKNES